MESHGDFRIWTEQRVLFVDYLGSMNDETGRRLAEEYIRVATPLAGAPFAALIDLSEFFLGTPGTLEFVAQARRWMHANGLTHQATVSGDTGAEVLHRRYINMNTPEGFEVRYFKDRRSAQEWLRELGYLDT